MSSMENVGHVEHCGVYTSIFVILDSLHETWRQMVWICLTEAELMDSEMFAECFTITTTVTACHSRFYF